MASVRKRNVGDTASSDSAGAKETTTTRDESRTVRSNPNGDSKTHQGLQTTGITQLEYNPNDEDFVRLNISIPKWAIWGAASFVISVTIMLVAYAGILHFILRTYGVSAPTSLVEELGVDGMMLFRQYDRDDDGYLSIGEFEPLAHMLRQTNSTFEYKLEIADNDEVITVTAFMEPLDLSTMTKDMDSVFTGSLDAITGLKSWQRPNIRWMNFGASEFKAFLPKTNFLVENIGEVYDIVVFSKGFFDGPLSNNRYYPPRIKDEEVLFHRLLTLLHPRPFLHSRFAPQGSTALVRAYNDQYLCITFRIHAEFQLNEPPFHPFWFTPAQFTGELIITRNASNILYFKMYVPTVKKLNVDMEWLNGPRENENMEVDIGYLPLMELNTSSSSLPALLKMDMEPDPPMVPDPAMDPTMMDSTMNLKELELTPMPHLLTIKDSIQWTKEITMEEAARRLEVKMYKFKEVPYLDFNEAYDRAAAEKKLIHSILLWGALDDQSC